MIRSAVRFVDQRSGSAPLLRKALRYVFPDHWSFLLGEVALYCFVVLVGTGIFLTFFYSDSTATVVYHGPYRPLQGQEMTHAYKSVLDLSTVVKPGLLMRQTHHWAANVFIVAIVLHLLRVFFTGAYRKPRELTYWIGLLMLMTALLEGYIGYSLVDDLLSGMGLAIGYAVALSVPFVGANLASLIWNGPFPGGPEFFPRMFIAHVLLLPVLIGTLLAVHLLLVTAKHHTQFRDARGQTERKVVGVPAFPGQAPRSLGLFLVTVGVLFLLGGLAQINPIWLWGPFHTYASTNGAQPDWYLGWLIGGLRLVPGWDLVIGGRTIVPNPFWGGVLFPLVVFGFAFVWPVLERRITGDHAFHNVVDRPRDAPLRTAVGIGVISWVFVVFLAGSADRVTVAVGLDYETQIWVYRVLVWIVPLVAAGIAYRACVELQGAEQVDLARFNSTPTGESEADAPG